MVGDTRFPPDVQVKKGYSWSEQLGIAIAVLVEGGEGGLVDWVKDVRIWYPFLQQHFEIKLKTCVLTGGLT
jgi:replication fork protection complex subunit Tof1/Swi1